MTEQEQFEQWLQREWPDCVSVARDIHGSYRYGHTKALFGLWRELREERRRNVGRFAFCMAVILQALVVMAVLWGCA